MILRICFVAIVTAISAVILKINKPEYVPVCLTAGGVLLCGSTTALAGPIGFIGLLAPHIMRLLLGSNLRLTIPLSALAGAVILTIADVIGRLLLYPGELEVGIVTAFVGAPVLIAIAIRSKA